MSLPYSIRVCNENVGSAEGDRCVVLYDRFECRRAGGVVLRVVVLNCRLSVEMFLANALVVGTFSFFAVAAIVEEVEPFAFYVTEAD
jgi:hypothetical protein